MESSRSSSRWQGPLSRTIHAAAGSPLSGFLHTRRLLPHSVVSSIVETERVGVFRCITKNDTRIAVKVYSEEHGIQALYQLANEEAASDQLNKGNPLFNTQVLPLRDGQHKGVAYVCADRDAADEIAAWEAERPAGEVRWQYMEGLALRLAACALTALAEVHAQGGMVTDIKLANFLYMDAWRLFQVADWGGFVSGQSGMWAPTFTFGMLSPEEADNPIALLAGNPTGISAASDVWKVGLCLVVLLFGKLPRELRWEQLPPGASDAQEQRAVEEHCAAVLDWAEAGRWGEWLDEQGVGEERPTLKSFLLLLLEAQPGDRIPAAYALQEEWLAGEGAWVAAQVVRREEEWRGMQAAVLRELVGEEEEEEEGQGEEAAAVTGQQQQVVAAAVGCVPLATSSSRPLLVEASTMTEEQEVLPTKPPCETAVAAAAAAALPLSSLAPLRTSRAGGWGEVEVVEGPATPPGPLSRAASAPLPGPQGRARRSSTYSSMAAEAATGLVALTSKRDSTSSSSDEGSSSGAAGVAPVGAALVSGNGPPIEHLEINSNNSSRGSSSSSSGKGHPSQAPVTAVAAAAPAAPSKGRRVVWSGLMGLMDHGWAGRLVGRSVQPEQPQVVSPCPVVAPVAPTSPAPIQQQQQQQQQEQQQEQPPLKPAGFKGSFKPRCKAVKASCKAGCRRLLQSLCMGGGSVACD